MSKNKDTTNCIMYPGNNLLSTLFKSLACSVKNQLIGRIRTNNVHHDVKEIQIVKGSVKPLAEGYTFKPYFE